MTIRPITPDDIGTHKYEVLPKTVIVTWNELIALNFTAGRARIEQEEIVCALCKAMACERRHVFDQKWLDIEEVYREFGWDVAYDKPGYNEGYEPSFKFTPKR